MEIYHQCASEELVLRSPSPVLMDFDAEPDGQGDSLQSGEELMMINPDGTKFVEDVDDSVASSGKSSLRSRRQLLSLACIQAARITDLRPSKSTGSVAFTSLEHMPEACILQNIYLALVYRTMAEQVQLSRCHRAKEVCRLRCDRAFR